ncbi:MAG: LysM peptidoglycan-binding domain-containing protein [Chloroflexota bacterium]
MRKKNKVFLILALLLVGLMISACERSALPNNTVAEGNGVSGGDQLGAILTDVAEQDPVGEVTPEGSGEKGEGDGIYQLNSPTPDGGVVVQPEPTETPVPPTATPVPTPEPVVVPTTYTLQKGEHPYCLARRFDVDVDDLLAANNLARGAMYPEGLTLTIPTSADAFQGQRSLLTHPVLYTIQYGDTWFTIACRYGDVFPEEIASMNGMSLNDVLTYGEQLQIP